MSFLFKKMIERVSKDGLAVPTHNLWVDQRGVSAIDKRAHIDEEERLMAQSIYTGFFECVDLCESFVMLDRPTPEVFTQLNDSVEDPFSVNLPFKVMSIEFLRPSPGKSTKTSMDFDCHYIIELEPGRQAVFSTHGFDYEVPIVYARRTVTEALKLAIDSIHTSQLGSSEIFERVKLGPGRSAKTHYLRKIIYVGSKEQLKSEEISNLTLMRKIDWTHRFSVRGHWRKLDPDQVGKDHNGYPVLGKTWVSEHIRGPEDKPFFKKMRVVPVQKPTHTNVIDLVTAKRDLQT